MIIAFAQDQTQSEQITVENSPFYSFAQEVKLFDKGENSPTYKIFAIAISTLTQDDEYGFWEANYIYALHDADSKPSTVNLRWEFERDLVRADFWEDSEF
jgi:hypothetical protein